MLGAVCVTGQMRYRRPESEPEILDTAITWSPGVSGDFLLVMSGGTSTDEIRVAVTWSFRVRWLGRAWAAAANASPIAATPTGRRACVFMAPSVRAAGIAVFGCAADLRLRRPTDFRRGRFSRPRDVAAARASLASAG